MNGKPLAIHHAMIYTPDRVIADGALHIREGRIAGIAESLDGLGLAADIRTIDAGARRLIPGMIDVHVHGGGGCDVMTAEAPDFDVMSRFHAARGTTAFLATTYTGERSAIEKAVANIARAMERGTQGADIVGIHLEGPFLNPDRCGAQNPAFIRRGTMEEMASYLRLAQGAIRLMTIAPESEGNMEVIRYALEQGITVSIGHSDATYDMVQAAVKLGVSHVTHLFNGMRPLHHREPGVAGAGLMIDELAVELIGDGVHVRKELLAFVFKMKPKSKVVMITDCVSAAGLPDGEYRLGSEPTVKQGDAIHLLNADGSLGSLAGSTLTLDKALANALAFTGKPLEDILPAFTMNPAAQIGLDRHKGSIEAGKDADMVLLDANGAIAATFVRGNLVHANEEFRQGLS